MVFSTDLAHFLYSRSIIHHTPAGLDPGGGGGGGGGG